MVQNIRDLREKLDAAGYENVPIQVDGGINRDTIDAVLDAGASVIVAGSAVFNGEIRGNAQELMAKMSAKQ
jgi:ribulose-phosphate 3-epimerase